jgi:hypothetical protein
VSVTLAVKGMLFLPIIFAINGIKILWVYLTVTLMAFPFPSHIPEPIYSNITSTLLAPVETVRSIGVLDAPRTRDSMSDEFSGSIEPYSAPSWAASRIV